MGVLGKAAEQQPQQYLSKPPEVKQATWKKLHLIDHTIPSCCYDGVDSFPSQCLKYVALTVLCFVSDPDLDPVSLLPASQDYVC